MEKLNITEEEQEGLKIFINRRIRNKRDYAKNGTKYKEKRRMKYAQATENKRISKEQRNKEIRALKQKGYTNKQLMEMYGLSKRTIQYIVNN